MSIYSSMRNSFKLLLCLAFVQFPACKSNDLPVSITELQPFAVYDLDIPEPSGLAIGRDGIYLWIISDTPDNGIYKTDLSGKVLYKLNFHGDDLEGVWYNPADNTLWLAEEQLYQVVQVDTAGKELKRYPIDSEHDGQSGLEGICMDDSRQIWLLNEKNPARILSLDDAFIVRDKYSLNLADDLSGITWATHTRVFWLVSDESKLLIMWNPDKGVIQPYKIPIKQVEGVAIDEANSRIYVVSDREQRLYVFNFSDM